MMELGLRLLKGFFLFILAFLLPLHFWFLIQSIDDLVNNSGWESVNPPIVGSIFSQGTKLNWWKLQGVLPPSTLLPFWGQNWVSKKNAGLVKWGGCAIPLMTENKWGDYFIMKSFAFCERIEASPASLSFLGFNENQWSVIQESAKVFPYGTKGPVDYIYSNYALLNLSAAVGKKRTSELYTSWCSQSFVNKNSDKRLECLAFIELSEVLSKVTPQTENERRLVAIKSGVDAWLWSLADPTLMTSYEKYLYNSSVSPALRKNIATWAQTYRTASSNRFSLKMLNKSWKVGDFDLVNEQLEAEKKPLFLKEAWLIK